MSSGPNKRIAVIGAGAAGIAAAKYLLAEGLSVTILERKTGAGGVWNTQPGNGLWPSPVYDGLTTNVPRTLMTFANYPWPADASLFPTSSTVNEYLQAHLAQIRNSVAADSLCVSFATEVTDLRKSKFEHSPSWKIKTRTYRFGQEPTDQNVLVVGNSASGWDISLQLASTAKTVYVSTSRKRNENSFSAPTHIGVPQIRSADATTRSVTFEDGTVARDLDCVVFCTGYVYDFSFIHKGDELLFPAGLRVRNVYEHMFYTEDPTLTFVGLPKMSAAFNVVEAQSAVVARLLNKRISIQSKRERNRRVQNKEDDWEEQMRLGEAGASDYHSFRLAEDKEYVNRMLEWSMEAVEPTAFGDNGLPPPYWCKCLDTAREQSRDVRAAFNAKGDNRHGYTSVRSLGFKVNKTCAEGRSKMKGRFCSSCFI
ncbi:hypothetical protein LTR08_008509 [Meristemomyces frigidus]|nr:hypothetical protein LTR08_008509 [Meristemomyces frigidus]